MIAVIHHMPHACCLLMTHPHHKDCLRWQGQTPGELRLLRRNSQRTYSGGEDRLGLWGHAAGIIEGARIASGGIYVAKITIRTRRYVPSPGWAQQRFPWIAGSELSANNTGEGCLYPKNEHWEAFNSEGAWSSKVFGVV